MEFVGQMIGFAAMAVSIIIYWQGKRKNRLKLKLSSDVLWSAHHLMIASYAGAATTAVAIFREIVFYNYNKKWARSKWWYIGFSVVFTFAALLMWRDAFSGLAALSSVLSTIAFGSKRAVFTRGFGFMSSAGMLIYGVHYNSVATVVNECITETSILMVFISIWLKNKRG